MIDLSSKRDQRAGVSRCYLCSNARGCALVSLFLSLSLSSQRRTRAFPFPLSSLGKSSMLSDPLSASGDAETVALA